MTNIDDDKYVYFISNGYRVDINVYVNGKKSRITKYFCISKFGCEDLTKQKAIEYRDKLIKAIKNTPQASMTKN